MSAGSDLHEKTLELAARRGISYGDAQLLVYETHPELAQRYEAEAAGEFHGAAEPTGGSDAGVEVDKRARELAAKEGVSYADALDRVLAMDPALAQAYATDQPYTATGGGGKVAGERRLTPGQLAQLERFGLPRLLKCGPESAGGGWYEAA